MSSTLVRLTSDQEASLFKCSNALFFRKTFYALLLENVSKYYSPEEKTACVSISPQSKGINLVLGSWFFDLNTVEQTFILEHELMHISFDHFYVDYLKYVNKHFLRVAADFSVNSWLQNEVENLLSKNHEFGGIPMLFPSSFGLESKQSLNYYYDILVQEQQDRESGKPGNPDLDPFFKKDGEDNDGSEIGDFELCEGSEGEKEIQKVLTDSIKKKTLNKLSEAERGKYPELQDMIKELFDIKESKVNWKRELRQFIGKSEKRDFRKTYLKKNKRFESAKGKKTLYKSKIGFVVDQSGSMDDDSVEEGFNEIYHVHKQGTSVYVIEADTGVSNDYLFKGKPIKTRSACGGTFMSPAIEYANTIPDLGGIIVFTDGYIESTPVVSKIPLIWIVTKNGSTRFNTPHKILQIN